LGCRGSGRVEIARHPPSLEAATPRRLRVTPSSSVLPGVDRPVRGHPGLAERPRSRHARGAATEPRERNGIGSRCTIPGADGLSPSVSIASSSSSTDRRPRS